MPACRWPNYCASEVASCSPIPTFDASSPTTNGPRPNTNCKSDSPSSLRRRLTSEQAQLLRDAVAALVENRVIEVIARPFYQHNEAIARRRVPRDPNDWAPVALALALGAGILTTDHDFLGCGCPTWTVETLRDELNQPWTRQ